MQPLLVREGGTMPVASALEKLLGAPAILLPMGQVGCVLWGGRPLWGRALLRLLRPAQRRGLTPPAPPPSAPGLAPPSPGCWQPALSLRPLPPHAPPAELGQSPPPQ